MSLWRDRCIAARERSEKILREQSALPKWSTECVSRAIEQANQIQQQYRSRLTMANGEARDSLEKDLSFETELVQAQKKSFLQPDIRVDSIGAVFVSNQCPFVEIEEEDD